MTLVEHPVCCCSVSRRFVQPDDLARRPGDPVPQTDARHVLQSASQQLETRADRDRRPSETGRDIVIVLTLSAHSNVRAWLWIGRVCFRVHLNSRVEKKLRKVCVLPGTFYFTGLGQALLSQELVPTW